MIRIPADAPHIKIADIGKAKIFTVHKKLIVVNAAYVPMMHNLKAKRFLIRKLCQTHTK